MNYNDDPYNNPTPFFIKIGATSLLLMVAFAVVVFVLKLAGCMP